MMNEVFLKFAEHQSGWSWSVSEKVQTFKSHGIFGSSFAYVFIIFAAASPTLYYRFEPKFYVNFRQSEVFLNCNIHHTS